MKNENFLNLYSQERLHQQLNKCAKEIGGKNIFLQLLEAIREAQPHPLTERNCEFRFDLGTIKWRKPIFREKVSLLKHVRLVNKDGNIFPKKGD